MSNRIGMARGLCAALSGLVLTAALGAAPDAHQGGKLRIVSQSAYGTIDPQVNYTDLYWQLFQSVYDGLTAFKKAAGAESYTVVPDLAESLPKVLDGGKTYVFKLREGIQFSDGRPLTVNDVVASFERIFKVLSPTAGSLYGGIVGADACLKEPASCRLAGGVTADAKGNTITIHLQKPDPEFLDKLSLPHASILPANAPPRDVGVSPIAGTGPYMISAYDPKKLLKLERNPHFSVWSIDAQPAAHPDEVDFEFGLPVEDEVTSVANGQVDWLYNDIPADRLNELGTRFAQQVHVVPRNAIYYLPMNTRLAPFDNLKVRQAVNFALDRRALVKLYGGINLATPSCQILPPGFPGYEPYCPYSLNPGKIWSAPDLARAKELVKASGTVGQKVTMITTDTHIGRAIGTYVQGVLSDLGYDVSVRAISENIEFTYIQNTQNRVQISYTQWYPDYPEASDFLNVLFSCASFREGSDASVNIAGLCDHALDAEFVTALSLAGSDPVAANRLWSELDRKVTDLAPVAVMFNPKRANFMSQRVKNIVISNQFQWLFAQSWVQ